MRETVAIIDYDSGNLHSAAKAFEYAALPLWLWWLRSLSPTWLSPFWSWLARHLGKKIIVTKDPNVVRKAKRIVLPGVGAYADCWSGLSKVPGMLEAIEEGVRKDGKPFLGICVGMQLLSERGYEHTITDGLGWISGEVRRITPDDPNLKIPHMGWNTLHAARSHPLLKKIPTGADGWHAYFVHSYAFTRTEDGALLATTDYGGPVTAIVAKDNIVGTQFHPEKSQRLGLRLIGNFLRWRP